MKKHLILLLLCAIFAGNIFAQSDATVPDVTGLNLPQAVATLNRAGIALGAQIPQNWQLESGLPQNSIAGQSLAAGTTVPRGTTIDLTILRTPNMRLIYDDNDITIMNLTPSPINVIGMVFSSTEGASASYSATQSSDTLREGQCFQLWSVGRNGPKDVEGCQYIQVWNIFTDPSFQFWTQSSGSLNFRVVENGVERANCPAAGAGTQDAPLTCEFFVAGGSSGGDTTPYVYLAYTTDVIAFINNSPDLWMPTTNTLYNFNPAIPNQGATLVFGDPALLREDFRVGLGDVTLLAPNQCIVFTTIGSPNTQPPQSCDVVASRALDANVAFWAASFQLDSVTDGKRRSCPAPTPGRTTLCILPR